MLGAMYTLCLIDRTNIAGARISGIDEALGLAKGNRYSIALLVFYIGYVIFQLPSNMVLKRVGSSLWMSILGIAWGLLTVGLGLVKTWQGLAVIRAFLGVLEAGLFPGCVYLIGSWYQKHEVQKR